MPVRARLPTTRRQHAVNWGNSISVKDAQVSTLLYVSEEDGGERMLTIQCTALAIPPIAIGTGDFRPYAHIAWGHGGADVETDIEVTYRQRISIPASKVSAQVFIKSMPLAESDGTFLQPVVPAGSSASFRGFVSEGVDGNPLYPTLWLTQMGVNAGTLVGPKGVGMIVGQQARLVSFRGWAVESAGGGGLRFFHLFDQAKAPANGDIPVDGFPIAVPASNAGPGETPPLPFVFTRAFTHGLAWAVSSTPFVLTLDATAQAFVTAELQS